MSKVYERHVERLRTTLLRRYSAASIAKWIVENTFYAGMPYSYKDHEYQEAILSDTATEVIVRKCSQVGISEASARMALALVHVMSPYTVAYTLPTAGFAGVFAKTRIDPIIDGSQILKESVHKTNNNNEVKQFGDSFLFLRGAASSNAPISIPVDHLIHDEYDFSDLQVLGQYISRLTHSKWRRKSKISTPTVAGYGVDLEFQSSIRKFLMCKCSHCNHQFLPSYYEHVYVPGFTGHLSEFTKRHLNSTNWENAELRCPKCDKVPDLSPKFREWVAENPQDKYKASGWQVSPFDAPAIITAPYLVESSTSYDRRQDFDNFGLGLAVQDKEATLSRGDFKDHFIRQNVGSGWVNVMGVDIGSQYHFVVWAINGWGQAVCIRKEQVNQGKARAHYDMLVKRYRIIASVMDSMPHAETVMALQENDPNLYAAVYVKKAGVLTYEIKEKPDANEEGRHFVRQVDVNRNRAFDSYMEFIRAGNLKIISEGEEIDNLYMDHHTDMKRTRVYTSDKIEMEYIWQKTNGVDHFHHASVYALIASKIKGISKGTSVLPAFHAFSASTMQKTPSGILVPIGTNRVRV